MPEKIMFTVQPRSILGKKVARLRRESFVPANITGQGQSLPVMVLVRDFQHIYRKAGETNVLFVKIGSDTTEHPVLISEVQHHPVTGAVQHVVLRQVNLNEKITAEVAVETTGELGVKNALVVTIHSAIKVSALPQDLPEKFIIDVSKFTQFGDAVTFAQLDYDKQKVELDVLSDQLNDPVVIVQEVKEVVEPEPIAAVAAEPGLATSGADGGEEKKADTESTEKKTEKK